MKKLFLITNLFLILSIYSEAQLFNDSTINDHKRFTIGGSGEFAHTDNRFSLQTNLRTAYLFSNNIELGLNTDFKYSGGLTEAYGLGIGPDIRYYFNNKRLTPFAVYQVTFNVVHYDHIPIESNSRYFGSVENGTYYRINHSIGTGLRLKSKNGKYSIEGIYSIGAYDIFTNKIRVVPNTILRLNYHF